MAETADVLSIDAIRDFRAALCTFADDAKAALDDVEFDLRRTVEWLTNEQRLFWQGEIKRWQQKLGEAKAELARKKLSKFLDREPDTSQEEKKVKLCETRLEEGHLKLALCKRWLPELQHAVQEYRGQSQPLADMVAVEIPRGIGRLERMIDALESYLRLSAPSTPKPSTIGLGGGAKSMARELDGGGSESQAEPPTSGDAAP